MEQVFGLLALPLRFKLCFCPFSRNGTPLACSSGFNMSGKAKTAVSGFESLPPDTLECIVQAGALVASRGAGGRHPRPAARPGAQPCRLLPVSHLRWAVRTSPFWALVPPHRQYNMRHLGCVVMQVAGWRSTRCGTGMTC